MSLRNEYTIVRSKRRTIGITVKQDGSVTVRIPLTLTKARAEAFVIEKQEWIKRAQERMAKKREAAGLGPDGKALAVAAFTDKEIKDLKKQAKKALLPMVAEVAQLMGVSYGSISIRAQKSRWGSCSSKGNLNFNCLLMLMPESIQRYVVVHELSHRIEMNHSARFWSEVAKYQPTFKEDRKALRELGAGLLERIP